MEYVLKYLLENNKITQNEYNILLDKYNTEGLKYVPQTFDNIMNSEVMTNTFIEIGIDLKIIYDLLNKSSSNLIRHKKIYEAKINTVNLGLDILEDKLYKIEQSIKNANRFIHYENFRDTSGISNENYIYDIVYFDKDLQAIKLNKLEEYNTLVSPIGTKMANVNIIKQFASELKNINNTNIESILYNDESLHWYESIDVDSPIELDNNKGALCQFLVKLDVISEINEITLIPLCEYPIEVLEIKYLLGNDYIPIIFKPNENNIPINIYLENKYSTKIISYQFDDIKTSELLITINQVHYTIKNSIHNIEDIMANSLYITKDNNELIDNILKPVEKAIYNNTFEFKIPKTTFKKTKLNYEYGLHNINIFHNYYMNISEYISNSFIIYKSASIKLFTNEEHYIYNNIKTTSIEYELLYDDIKIPILPYNTDKVLWEKLSVYQDELTNKYLANTRFDADITNLDNIKFYIDNNESNEFNFVDKNTIEIYNYNSNSIYCIDYKLFNKKQATEIRINEDKELKLRAILRQNSKFHTGVTPILYNYTVTVFDQPLAPGETNTIDELEIIPNETLLDITDECNLNVSDKDILKSIEPQLKTINITLDDKITYKNIK